MNAKEVNDTGLWPVEYKCVVKLDPVEEKIGSVFIPQDRKSRDQMAMTVGTLVAVGGNAFADWDNPRPRVGQRVIVNKYAGQFKEADPESRVRIINDREILAIYEE